MVHDNQLKAARIDTSDNETKTARFLHRLMGDRAQKKYDFSGYFQSVQPHIQGVDIAVCNLETTISGGEPTGYPRFNTPDAIADAIAGAGFSCVATANNHAYDSGMSGIINTRKALEKRSLQVVGTRKKPGEKAYALFTVNGVKVALLNYTYETAGKEGKRTVNNRAMNPEAKALLNSFCFESIEEDLENVGREMDSARKDGAQVVLVYYHWGNEYERHSNVFQKYVAWRTAHMGADAIIGAHAHVMQELDEIKLSRNGKEKCVPVFYGLGNYIWGAPPIYERETVLNSILAVLNIRYDEESGDVQVLPSWIPMYIGQKAGQFQTIDLQALSPEASETFAEHYGIRVDTVLDQIRDTVENRIHPASTEFYFDRIFRMKAGTRVSLLEGFLSEREYVEFRSEDAIVASVLQNGFVIGNSPGYVGITAVDAQGRETVCMVQILPGESGKFPVLVNAHNAVRDLYARPDVVKGEDFGLPDNMELCRPAAESWKAMLLAAREEGVHLKVMHAFRSKKDQTIRRRNYAKLYGDAAAKRRYQQFGRTEHHLGLALDVSCGEYNGEKTTKADAFQWVEKNACRYGFLARKRASKIENVVYIHLCYLEDQNLARMLTENGLTLEQYLTNYPL